MRYTTSEEPTIKTLCERYHLGRTTLSRLLNDPDFLIKRESARFFYMKHLLRYLLDIMTEMDMERADEIRVRIYPAFLAYFEIGRVQNYRNR